MLQTRHFSVKFLFCRFSSFLLFLVQKSTFLYIAQNCRFFIFDFCKNSPIYQFLIVFHCFQLFWAVSNSHLIVFDIFYINFTWVHFKLFVSCEVSIEIFWENLPPLNLKSPPHLEATKTIEGQYLLFPACSRGACHSANVSPIVGFLIFFLYLMWYWVKNQIVTIFWKVKKKDFFGEKKRAIY